MSIVGWFHQKVYPRLWPIGLVVWTLVAVIICAFDEKTFGVGAYISVSNINLGLISLNKKHNTHIKLVNNNIMMHCGALFVLLSIFMRFGSSVFVNVKYELLAISINFVFYLIYRIFISTKEPCIEGVHQNEKE